MLDVEEPDARRAGEQGGRHLHEQVRRATPPASTARPPARASAMFVAITLRRMRGRAERETRRGCRSSRVDRPEPEHHERVPEQAVPEPPPPRRRPVLRDGQREDVADAPPVQVTGRGVMDRVTVSPAHERRVDDQAQSDAQPGVGALGRQERAVSAVVEHDVRPEQKAGGGDRQRQHEQVRDVQRQVHQHRAAPGTARPRSRCPAGCGPGAAGRTERGPPARRDAPCPAPSSAQRRSLSPPRACRSRHSLWRALPLTRQPLGASRRTPARCSRRPPSGPHATRAHDGSRPPPP